MQATATPPSSQNKSILTSRLKVLHIISGDLWAGAEVQAYTLLTSLQAQHDLIVTLMNHGELERKLLQAGIEVVVINEQQHSGWEIVKLLVAQIKHTAPDIIHTHRKKENILGSIANVLAPPLFRRRTKSLRTTHGADEHKARGIKGLINKLDRFCGRYLQDAIISVSHDLSEKLKHEFPPRKIHTIENGIDINKLRALTPAPDIRKNREQHIHVGIIGRLEPVKRVDLFIKAAREIHKTPNIDSSKIIFHIIGDGSLKDELIELSHQLKLEHCIIFHGYRNDSAQAIAALDIVVMCSDHEGTPMAALETLALGKPLIAHNVGGLREILNEHTEFLVGNHTPTGYSLKILQCISNPHTIELKKIYHSDENAKKVSDLYNQLHSAFASKKLTIKDQK